MKIVLESCVLLHFNHYTKFALLLWKQMCCFYMAGRFGVVGGQNLPSPSSAQIMAGYQGQPQSEEPSHSPAAPLSCLCLCPVNLSKCHSLSCKSGK